MRLVERLLLSFIRGSLPSATLQPRPNEGYPSGWRLSFLVQTDAERDQLQQDWNVERKLRTLLTQVGYPTNAITSVKLHVESGQTMQREYQKHGYAAFY